MRRAAAVLLLSASNWSCGAGWRCLDLMTSQSGPLRQQVQVWRAGRAVQLHAVRVTADSISGVPFFQTPSCDSCRVTLPRAEVDSVRVGDPVAGFWASAGLVLATLVLLMSFACMGGCSSA